jgi:hypothetical protein
MESDKIYDMAFLNKVSGGDKSFILEMVKTFKEVAPVYIVKAKKLLQENNIELLGKETHRVIPGVTFVGAKTLEKELMMIEEYAKKNINLDKLPDILNKCEDLIVKLIDAFDKDFILE